MLFDYDEFMSGEEEQEEPMNIEIKGFKIIQKEDEYGLDAYEVISPRGKLLFGTIDRDEVIDFIDKLSDRVERKHGYPTKG